MANNCSSNTSNACSPCSGCEIIVPGACVTYGGAGISGLTYPSNPTVDQMIDALGAELMALKAIVQAL